MKQRENYRKTEIRNERQRGKNEERQAEGMKRDRQKE